MEGRKWNLTPPGLPSDAVTMSVYWSVVSLSRGFPRRSRPILKREDGE